MVDPYSGSEWRMVDGRDGSFGGRGIVEINGDGDWRSTRAGIAIRQTG